MAGGHDGIGMGRYSRVGIELEVEVCNEGCLWERAKMYNWLG